MKRTVGSANELPREFRLESYAAAKEFGIADWCANFSFRALRRSAFQTWKDDPQRLEEMRAAVRYLWSNALIPEASARVYCSESMNKFIEARQVRAQSALEALSGHWEMDESGRMANFAKAMRVSNEGQPAAEVDDAMRLLETPMWRAYQESGVDDEGTMGLTVNLQAPEDLLVEQFRTLLREIKQERNMEVPKRAVSEADLHDWSQHRILPYLDLTFWAEVEGVALTQQLLGEVLFPREYGVNLAERIRKTVAPLARKVVTYDFCNYLVVQVLEELRATGKIRLLPDEAKGVGAEGGLSPSRVARLFPDMKGEE